MKKYPAYKDSGIEWIGEIPEGWNIRKLKFSFNIIPSNVDKKSKDDEESVLLCNYVDVYKNDYVDSGLSFMTATASDNQITKLTLRQFDVIATKDSEDPNDIGVPSLVVENLEGVVCGYHLTLFRGKENSIIGRYLYWFLRSNICSQYFSTIARGVTRYALGTSAFSDLPLPTLENDETTTIANYLDRKTAEIDNLIEKKKQLIALYKEERTATINAAVTGKLDVSKMSGLGCSGLKDGQDLNNPINGVNPKNPDADRKKCLPAEGWKDSGIDWIGEIPEHWDYIQIKFLADVFNGSTPNSGTDEFWNGDVNWVTTDDLGKLEGKYIISSKRKITELGLKNCGTNLCPSGSVIISCRAPIGHLGILKVEACTNQGCKTIVPNRINSLFLYFYLKSQILSVQNLGKGTTFQELSTLALKDYKIVVPTLQEQTTIANYLDQKNKEYDHLISKTEKEIELLQEYKTALISEVVLGKVDVRGEKLS